MQKFVIVTNMLQEGLQEVGTKISWIGNVTIGKGKQTTFKMVLGEC